MVLEPDRSADPLPLSANGAAGPGASGAQDDSLQAVLRVLSLDVVERDVVA